MLWPLENALGDELKLDKKETNTMGRRGADIGKSHRQCHMSSSRPGSRGDGTTNTDESDYCDMKPSIMMTREGDRFSQAGEDMASLISFGSLPSSSGGSADANTCGTLTRDMDPSLRSLFRSNLSDEDILSTLVQWTCGDQASARLRSGCLPYLINLLHLHPLHVESARPTRHIRQVNYFYVFNDK